MEGPSPKPLDLLDTEGDLIRFKSLEAHENLYAKSGHYRSNMDEGGYIVDTRYSQNASGMGLLGETVKETHIWRFIVLSDSGEATHYKIEKEVTKISDQTVAEYRAGVPIQVNAMFPKSPLPRPAISHGCAVEMGRHLVEDYLLGGGWQTRIDEGSRNGQWSHVEERAVARMTYLPQHAGSAMTFTPWTIAIDSFTGKILEMMVSDRHLEKFDESGDEMSSNC